MDIQKFYESIQGDYNGALSRLKNENILQKFVVKFLDDPSRDQLVQALNVSDYDAAFRAAHTLKGLSANFSFTSLERSSSLLTQALRAGAYENVPKLAEQVLKDYEQIVSAIKDQQ